MNDHDHPHDGPPEPALPPETPVDAGSQALAEALRSSFAIVKVVMVLLVLVFLASGLLHRRAPGAGDHSALWQAAWAKAKRPCSCRGCIGRSPIPLTRASRSRSRGLQQVSSTVGWYAVTPEQMLAGIEPPAGGTLNPIVDGYALTADANIIHTPRHPDLPHQGPDPIRVQLRQRLQRRAERPGQRAALRRLAASRWTTSSPATLPASRRTVRRRVTQLVDKQDLGITRRAMRRRRASRRGS